MKSRNKLPPIIDIHLRRPASMPSDSPYKAWSLDDQAFVRALDRYEIRRAVIHAVPVPDGDAAAAIRQNRELVRFLERFPHRFVGACGVDVRYPEESLREVETWRKEFGMVWVGELSYPAKGHAPAIQAFHRIVEQAARLHMIVTVNADTEGASAIAREHPSATIVFSQTEFGMDPYVRRFEAIRSGANFCVNTAPRGYERMGLIEMAVERLSPARVLFGSNFAVNSAAAVIAKVENAFLSAEQQAAIFSGNAERLLEQAGWRF
jgi:predicted TIM-barrel fold metal-dependent hydrolase